MPIQQLQPEFSRPIYTGTWSGKPSAVGNAGKEIILTDIGRSRWWSNGTYWRPVGGRQVLAMRTTNPVTVQSLTGEVAETIGPFPGGLVRAGMRVELDARVDTPGIGSALRSIQLRVNSAIFRGGNTGVSSAGKSIGRICGAVDVLADGNATHVPDMFGNSHFALGVSNIYPPTCDFSAAWSADIWMQSAAENAVNISSATWASGVATFNTSAPHTLAVGDKTVIASVTPSGWNIPDGAIVLSVPTSTQFTVAMAADPGAYTSGGTSSRISNMISQSYVLELVG